MKKVIFLILISLLLTKEVYTEINDALFMTIGNKPVTKSDLVNEIKIILILNNESYSDSKKDVLHDAAVKSSIQRNVKLIELERNNYYAYNEKDYINELNRLAANIFVDLETLKNICATNELDFSIIEEQIKTELYWNSLIFELYKSRLTINPEQIDDQLKILQNKEEIEEYLISEIVISNVEEINLETTIQELKDKIKIEGFESAARTISISESSVNGGDLGWLRKEVVSEKIRSQLINTPIGQISEPILLDDGILVFQVRDKRNIDKNSSLEEMKEQLINMEKMKILNMHSLAHYDKVYRSIAVKFFQ